MPVYASVSRETQSEACIIMADNMEAEAPHNTFDTILVLDFGSQTSHLILRRLRNLKVYAEMLPCTTTLADLPFKPKGIVLSGGV